MPKIYVYCGIVIIFYSNEHEPVHVHGKYQGKESKAELIIKEGKVESVVIKSVKGRPPLPTSTLRDFEKFVNAYADKIVRKWIDYFVLHKQISCEIIERKVK
ncbi:DUF4160 domain-containing protein [Candidatus Kuenenia sp.]|uniref:DUF4160 domain-containing protein n=1 Tax=Candidatus Kuenenia sp. TaxID=2499824 RepID=UPI0032208391